MIFSYHQDGLGVGTRAVKAKWNGAHHDRTPFHGAFATSSAEIHGGLV
jgi:hypothetical protein